MLSALCGLLLSASGTAGESLQALSLDGRLLSPPPLTEPVRRQREAELLAAEAAWAARPDDLGALIWVGRRRAYLGDYQGALLVYSRGLRSAPGDPRLLRHRGHRYLTTRQFGRALADFDLAVAMIEGQDDVIEADGLPNDRGIPTSTLHGNIHYHRGLALYYLGRFEDAAGAFADGLAVARNVDMESAQRYWLYLSRVRAGRDDARSVLEPVGADWDIIENHAYHRLLLHFRGDLDGDQLGKALGDDALTQATVAYGLAMGRRMAGDEAGYRAALDRILAGSQWAAFGYLAAEADRFGDP